VSRLRTTTTKDPRHDQHRGRVLDARCSNSTFMNSVQEGPRHAIVTSENHGALIQIASWFVMVAVVLMTGLRLATRFKTARNPGIDDMICVAAMVSEHDVMYSPGSNRRLICAYTVGRSWQYHCYLLSRQLWPRQKVCHPQFVASIALREGMQTSWVDLAIMS
jgi:hypothetical protein